MAGAHQDLSHHRIPAPAAISPGIEGGRQRRAGALVRVNDGGYLR